MPGTLRRIGTLLALVSLSAAPSAAATAASDKAYKDIRIIVEFVCCTGYSGTTPEKEALRKEFVRGAVTAMRMWQSIFPAMNVTWVTNPADANLTLVVGNYDNVSKNTCGPGGGPSNPKPSWSGCSFHANSSGDIAGGRIYFNTRTSNSAPYRFDDFTLLSRDMLYQSYVPATCPTTGYGNPTLADGKGWIDGHFAARKDGEDATHIIVHEFGHTVGIGAHRTLDPLPFYGIPRPENQAPGSAPNVFANGCSGYPLLSSPYYGGGTDVQPWVSDLRALAVPLNQMAEYMVPPNPNFPGITLAGVPNPSLPGFNFRVMGRDLHNFLSAEIRARTAYPTTVGTIRLEDGMGGVRLVNNWDHAVSAAQLDIPYQSNPYMVTGIYPHSQTRRVALGSHHVLAIRNDGTLWAWGRNDRGQLGDGGSQSYSSPVQIGTATDWAAVAAGESFSLALRTDQSLWAWGDRTHGQLGDGIVDPVNVVREPKKIGDGWAGIAAGPLHALALRNDGTLWGWGFNGYGQLGTGNQSNSAEPVQEFHASKEWVSVSAGSLHSLATRADGSLWSWGWNDHGTLGNGNSATNPIPQPVSPGKTDWAMIEASHEHNIATDDLGRSLTWGRNQLGQLGGSGGTAYTPTQHVAYHAATTAYMKVAAGQAHTLALRKNGSLWSWGWNSNGQLGANQTVGSTAWTPVREATLSSKWKEVYAGAFFSAALDESGVLWTWGDNSSGQLGLGSSGSTPVNSPAKTGWSGGQHSISGLDVSDFITPQITITTVVTGDVRRVVFWDGSTQISGCDDTSPPFECNWQNVSVGNHPIFAVAYNGLNQAVTSSTMNITTQYLTISAGTPSSTVNMSTEGTVNWAHFGAGVRKSSGAVLPTTTSATTTIVDNVGSPTFTWSSGGTPSASGSTNKGLQLTNFSEQGITFTIDLPATSTTRTVRLYLRAQSASFRIYGNVDGNQVEMTWNNPSGARYYEFKYRTTPDKPLTIRIKNTGAGNIGTITPQAITIR